MAGLAEGVGGAWVEEEEEEEDRQEEEEVGGRGHSVVLAETRVMRSQTRAQCGRRNVRARDKK